jgi:hypothetical protein
MWPHDNIRASKQTHKLIIFQRRLILTIPPPALQRAIATHSCAGTD